ncbi:flagellar biosynthetic protein FliO [Aquabacterium sp. OR-4]|uniref:flagellar biosynthetic protein FliO n=1 Tax=Aquabacterium sp. OR-4 TaxID=2978127 RepID=UPI0021B2944B|nr:flagellar biosynthetic protein FliO [Aquabacterium sp. OR-4]MDT7837979.1 flagellar biosynthetic protein FliO [Aquabacterium sp. OR-4]
MPDLMRNLASTVLALAFVLLLAWGLLRGWRRLQALGLKPAADAGAALHFVRALPVGARERVVLIDHAGERWMLGVTAGGISLLARLPQPAAAPAAVDTRARP